MKTRIMPFPVLQVKNHLRVDRREKKTVIFDPVRKTWILSRPEEMVRILTIYYLTEKWKYNMNGFVVEKKLPNMVFEKRTDLIYYARQKPLLLIECKSFEERLSKVHQLQLFNYNRSISAGLLLLTNGHQCMAWDARGIPIDTIQRLEELARS